MKIIALLLALLIEQVRPLRRNNVLHGSYDALSQWLRRQFDAGEYRHGVVAWVSLKGRLLRVKDIEVMAAAKTHGLVDNKVCSFSETRTALRFTRRR